MIPQKTKKIGDVSDNIADFFHHSLIYLKILYDV